MTSTYIIHLSNLHTGRRARNIISSSQDGRCRFCNIKIDLDKDVIVSHGGPKRKYYHEKCARRLNII
jgi:hypothetical protein